MPDAPSLWFIPEVECRRWRNMTLQIMMVGYDGSYIGQIERGEKSPTLRTLINLAQVFELQLSALIRAAESRIKSSQKSTGV